MKPQQIRLWDVYLIGPLMIVAGMAAERTHPVIGPAVAAFGIGTILYNAHNYQRAERRERQGR